MGGAPDVRVGGVRLLRARPVRQAAVEQPLGHLLAAAEFGDEVGVQPRLVDPQARVGEQAVPVEPFDVVALEGGAVSPDLHAVLEHRAYQQGAGDGPPERGGVEVGAAAGPDVERAAGQRGKTFLDERLTAVDQAGQLRPVLRRAAGHRLDVRLVVLADIGGVGVRHSALLAHPRDRYRGVEAAREGDPDPFTDRERVQHLRHTESICILLHDHATR